MLKCLIQILREFNRISLKHKTNIFHLNVCVCYLLLQHSSGQVDWQQFFDNLSSQIHEFQNHAKIMFAGISIVAVGI